MAICKENIREQFLASTLPPSSPTLEGCVDGYMQGKYKRTILVFVFVCLLTVPRIVQIHMLYEIIFYKELKNK